MQPTTSESCTSAEVRQVLRDPLQRVPRREAMRRARRLLHGARPLRRHPQRYHLSVSLFTLRTLNFLPIEKRY